MTTARIRIRHPWGHGPWHPDADEPVLRAWCDDCNARYGAGTHTVEKEPTP